jgi:coenzyme F420-reducing hydrogenase delta subunit
VVVAGCAERSAYHRLGGAWTRERIAGGRNPYLRARVPRERLATIWASATEQRRFSRELGEFAAALATLPPAPEGHAVGAGGGGPDDAPAVEEEEALS